MPRKKKTLTESAQAMTEGMFSSAEDKGNDADVKKKEPQPIEVNVVDENPRKNWTTWDNHNQVVIRGGFSKGSSKDDKVPYGARISKDVVKKWKAYINASRSESGACVEKALLEYMERHELNDAQKQVFEIWMKE